MTLRNGEWQLSYGGTSYLFGTAATPVFHRTTPDVGDVDVRVADVDRPRQDGRAFGIDYRGGRTINFEMGVRASSSADAREQASILQRIWRADEIRQTPGAVAELRANYDGRERLMFGRPRRLAMDYSDATVNGFVGVVADFAMSDDLFYSVEEDSVHFGLIPPQGGGLIAPLAAPLATTLSSDRSQGIRVSSEMPVWPVVRIDGPVSNPVVNIGADIRFELRISLEYDEWVTIDTRPWARYALRNDVANVSGALRGTRLSRAALTSGAYEVGLKGTDPTGTSGVTVKWNRSTFPSL